MKHKHAEVIKAWADGAIIQYRCRIQKRWKDCEHNNPRWHALIKYRVKPTEKRNA